MQDLRKEEKGSVISLRQVLHHNAADAPFITFPG